MPPHSDQAAIEVSTLTGVPLSSAKHLLQYAKGNIASAVNGYYDGTVRIEEFPPEGEVDISEVSAETKSDLQALSVKELKKLISSAGWSLKGRNITEKAELVTIAVQAAALKGCVPPVSPKSFKPRPRIVRFEDEVDKAPAAALSKEAVHVAAPVPPASPDSPSRVSRLHDKVLVVLKGGCAATDADIGVAFEAASIPCEDASQSSSSLVMESLDRLREAFGQCAEDGWGGMCDSLQKILAAAIVAMQRDEVEDGRSAEATAAMERTCNQQNEVKALGDPVAPDMVAMEKKVIATRVLTKLIYEYVEKLAASKPQGVQSLGVETQQRALSEHQAQIRGVIEADRLAKAQLFKELQEGATARSQKLKDLMAQEEELMAAEATCTTEASLQQLQENQQAMEECLQKRLVMMREHALRHAELQDAYETRRQSLENWETVQAAGAETEKFIAMLRRQADAYTERTEQQRAEAQRNAEARLAGSLLSGAELQGRAVSVLHEKWANILATQKSTGLVLEAESPQNSAMNTVLAALQTELDSLEGRLGEIRQHGAEDRMMLEELKERRPDMEELPQLETTLAGIRP